MNLLDLTKIIRPPSRKTEIRTRLIINKKIIGFRETYMGKSVKVDYDFLKNDIVLVAYVN